MSSALDFSDIKPKVQQTSSASSLDFSDIKHSATTQPTVSNILDFSDKPKAIKMSSDNDSEKTFVFNYEYVRTKIDIDYIIYHDIMIPFLKKISLHDSIDYDLTEYGVTIQSDITTLAIKDVDTGDALTDVVLKKLDTVVDMATRKGFFSFLDKTKEIRQELVNLNTNSVDTLGRLNINLNNMRSLHDILVSNRNSLLIYINFGDFLISEFKYDNKERYIPLIESRINSLRSTEMVINNRILLLDIQINVLLRNLELLQDVYYNLIPNMLIEQTSERIKSLSNVIGKLKESISNKSH